MKQLAPVALLAMAASGNAAANLHYFTQDNFLYKYNDATAVLASRVELKLNGNSFTTGLEGRFASLAFDPNGQLWGATADGDFYTINANSGAVTHKFDGGGTIATFDFRQNNGVLEIIGTETLGGGASNLIRFNSSTGDQIGSDVSITLGGGSSSLNYAGNPASGYDSATGTYYVVRGGAASNATNDFALNAYNAADFTSVFGYGTKSIVTGNPATGLQWSSAAGAWADGELYFGYRPGVNAGQGNWNLPTLNDATLYFGRLNTATGAFTQDFTLPIDVFSSGTNSTDFPLSNGIASGTSFGYAVAAIPEADTYAFIALGMGLVGLLARRRQSTGGAPQRG